MQDELEESKAKAKKFSCSRSMTKRAAPEPGERLAGEQRAESRERRDTNTRCCCGWPTCVVSIKPLAWPGELASCAFSVVCLVFVFFFFSSSRLQFKEIQIPPSARLANCHLCLLIPPTGCYFAEFTANVAAAADAAQVHFQLAAEGLERENSLCLLRRPSLVVDGCGTDDGHSLRARWQPAAGRRKHLSFPREINHSPSGRKSFTFKVND